MKRRRSRRATSRAKRTTSGAKRTSSRAKRTTSGAKRTTSRAKRTTASASKSDDALALEYRAWAVDNLARGATRESLVDALAARVSRSRAMRELAAIENSPLLPLCTQLSRRVRRLELLAALARAHANHEPDRTSVERRTTIDADELYRHYWAAHRPVLLTELTASWPALQKWTPAWFRDELGGITIEVTSGRESDPRYDQNQHLHRKKMRMDRFIDRVLEIGASNDLYLVSNNRTMRRAAFARLLDDIRPPEALFEPLRGSATSLWIGPAGTVTGLHHDTTNILFCQIYGRKRIELVAPHETALLLDPMDGFYSALDLDRLDDAAHPALRSMLVKQVVVGPGDALFIPAGWWHRVTSLDVSISFSLLNFRRPNDFDWYRPGHL